MLVNTSYFSAAAKQYEEKGSYSNSFYKSKEYYDFWTEEKRRCLEGYKVGDLYITGRHYYYLNYAPMKKQPDDDSGINTKTFIQRLPDFWEVDLHWFNAVDQALREGKHLVCLKTRRAGFSYKAAALATYNYNFIRDSKSIITASGVDYLTKDGILNKCWDNLDWLNDKTERYWLKNRSFKDTMMHKRASYKYSGTNVERGRKSDIIGVIVNDANKIRGKAGELIIFEEAGSYPNLLQAWQIAYGSVTQGKVSRGLMIAFGTGGEEGPSLEGLEELYYNPETHNILPFENIYDSGRDKVGFFVPAYMCALGFIDQHGNALVNEAKEFYMQERAKKEANKDPKALDRYIAEFPFTPEEALQRLSSNPFPVKQLRDQKERIMHDKDLLSSALNGILIRNKEGQVEFKPTKDRPFLDYPVKPDKGGSNIDGCITIWETPYKETEGAVVNRYIIATDPVQKDRDQATSSDSVFATYVYRRDTDTIVASYIGRPKTRDNYYVNLFMLAEYYNTKVQCEATGGGDGVYDYAKRTNKLHYLEYDALFDNKKEIVSEKNRSYLLKMNKERKEQGLVYLAQWLTEERGVSEDGYVYNYQKIYDLGLLEELIKYNEDNNFDRISAMIIVMFMKKEYHSKSIVIKTEKKDSLFNRKLFTDNPDKRGYITYVRT